MRKRKDSDMFEAAARFIYLNRTCFNGLYQVSSALQKAKLAWQEFQETEPSAGDFIYCDPPYDGYAQPRFNGKEQEMLARRTKAWHSRIGGSPPPGSTIFPLYYKGKNGFPLLYPAAEF